MIRDTLWNELPACYDELSISDDFPSCKTKESISELMSRDKRIVYINGPGRGVVANFELAISEARGDFIFLSDQDDVWLDGKVERVVRELEGGADLVLHNADITDGELNKTGENAFELNRTKTGLFNNIIKILLYLS